METYHGVWDRETKQTTKQKYEKKNSKSKLLEETLNATETCARLSLSHIFYAKFVYYSGIISNA